MSSTLDYLRACRWAMHHQSHGNHNEAKVWRERAKELKKLHLKERRKDGS